jgi:hypothetical protein
MPWKHIKDGLQQVGENIEKGVKLAGDSIEKGVKQAGSTIEKEAKKASSTVSSTIEKGVKLASDTVQDHLPSPPPVKAWVDHAIDGTKDTLAEVSDTVSQNVLHHTQATRTQLNQLAKDTTHTFQSSAEFVKEGIQTQVNKVGGKLHEGVSITQQSLQHATQNVNTEIADVLDKIAGERVKTVTDFIRAEGIQTVAGLAFTPIYVAQRGVIGYEAYCAFDRGEISLGDLMIQILSPTAHTAQTFLKDPENQELITKFVSKVIPEKVQYEYLATVTEAGEKVGGFIPQTPQERIRTLLHYRKPLKSSEAEQATELASERIAKVNTNANAQLNIDLTQAKQVDPPYLEDHVSIQSIAEVEDNLPANSDLVDDKTS